MGDIMDWEKWDGRLTFVSRGPYGPYVTMCEVGR